MLRQGHPNLERLWCSQFFSCVYTFKILRYAPTIAPSVSVLKVVDCLPPRAATFESS